MELKIYENVSAASPLYTFRAVASCELVERLTGELTLSFDVPTLSGEIVEVGQVAELDGRYFDIVRVSRAVGDIPSVSAECEHVSYRLNNEEYNLVTFVYTGTVAGGLAEILAGTPFSVGTCKSGTYETAFTDESPLNRRSALIRYAAAVGAEIEYDGWSINLPERRGNATRRELMDGKTVTALSMTADGRAGTESYDLAFYKKFDIGVGDEVHIGYTPLGIDKNTTVIGVAYNPFYTYAARIEVGDYMPDSISAEVAERQKIRQEFRAANGELLSKIESYDGRFTSIEQDIDGLTLTAQSVVGGVTEDVDVGEYVDLGTTHGFAKNDTSSSWDGYYYASNSASFPTGNVNAYTTAYGKIVFNFSRDTVVTVSSRVRGQSGSSIRMSAVDVDMSVDGTSAYAVVHNATTTLTAYTDTINIPPGEHFVTFAYVRGTGSSANYFSASFRFQADVPNPSAKSTIQLLKNGVEISTAEVVFDGLATTTELRAEFDAYVNGEEGKAAIKSAVEGTFITVDELQDYAKKDEIPDVSEFVTESSLSTSINQYINGTDGKAAIESVVSGTYATKDEIGNFVTSSEVSASIIQEIDALESKLTLSASVNGNSSTLTLKSGSAELSSAEITFDGFVTFTDLSTDGRTTISGGNIASNSITADKLNVDELYVRTVLFNDPEYAYNVISSEITAANARVFVGLRENLDVGFDAAQFLELYGTKVYLIRTGYDLAAGDSDNYSIQFDMVNRQILSGSSSWTIGYFDSVDDYQDFGDAVFSYVYADRIYCSGRICMGELGSTYPCLRYYDNELRWYRSSGDYDTLV